MNFPEHFAIQSEISFTASSEAGGEDRTEGGREIISCGYPQIEMWFHISCLTIPPCSCWDGAQHRDKACVCSALGWTEEVHPLAEGHLDAEGFFFNFFLLMLNLSLMHLSSLLWEGIITLPPSFSPHFPSAIFYHQGPSEEIALKCRISEEKTPCFSPKVTVACAGWILPLRRALKNPAGPYPMLGPWSAQLKVLG